MEDGIPKFRADGYLPEGLYNAVENEVTFRFGASSRQRRRLALRLRRWIELARLVGGLRLLVDGSFVTAKAEPADIDAVILLPLDFQRQIELGVEAALEMSGLIFSAVHAKLTDGEKGLGSQGVTSYSKLQSR